MTRSRTALLAGALSVATFLLLFSWTGAVQAHVIERASVAGDGTQGNYDSDSPSISADGRYVAFESWSDNLVVGDTNDYRDVFVHDRQTGETERVSVASDGTQGNQNSVGPCISADGRYVAFTSGATDLVDGDANGRPDVFLRDRQAGTTERVSVDSAGNEGSGQSRSPSISADGRYVAFVSAATDLVDGDTNGREDVFVRDRLLGITSRVSVGSGGAQGNSDSSNPSISADGRFVAFLSAATDLVDGDTNGWWDVFVHDRQAGTTERVSAASDGTQGDYGGGSPSISADGRFVAFDSYATDLVPGDTNGSMDVFVRDRQAGTTELISPNGAGTEVDHWSDSPSISADGRYLAFETRANGTPGGNCLAVQDRQTGYTRWVMGAAGEPFSISADGRCVALRAWADYVAPGNDHQVFGIFVVVDPLGPPTYVSLRGTDRYDTAIKVSRAGFPEALPTGSGLVLAPGETFQEALCGAPLAVAYGGPVLLTTRSGLDSRVKAEILRLKPEYVICVGLSDAIRNAVQAALGGTGTVSAIRGSSVYDMSYKVAKALGAKLGGLSTAVAIVTRGDLFPDVVGVSPLACVWRWPILLTGPGNVLSIYATHALDELGITRALKVGTHAALPAAVAGVGNLSGGDRYQTNRNVAEWAKNNAHLSFTHLAIATGEKFPDALTAGPYLASDRGTLLLSPLYGPVPAVIAAEITANAAATWHVSYIAMIEPVVSQVKALLP